MASGSEPPTYQQILASADTLHDFNDEKRCKKDNKKDKKDKSNKIDLTNYDRIITTIFNGIKEGKTFEDHVEAYFAKTEPYKYDVNILKTLPSTIVYTKHNQNKKEWKDEFNTKLKTKNVNFVFLIDCQKHNFYTNKQVEAKEYEIWNTIAGAWDTAAKDKKNGINRVVNVEVECDLCEPGQVSYKTLIKYNEVENKEKIKKIKYNTLHWVEGWVEGRVEGGAEDVLLLTFDKQGKPTPNYRDILTVQNLCDPKTVTDQQIIKLTTVRDKPNGACLLKRSLDYTQVALVKALNDDEEKEKKRKEKRRNEIKNEIIRKYPNEPKEAIEKMINEKIKEEDKSTIEKPEKPRLFVLVTFDRLCFLKALCEGVPVLYEKGGLEASTFLLCSNKALEAKKPEEKKKEMSEILNKFLKFYRCELEGNPEPLPDLPKALKEHEKETLKLMENHLQEYLNSISDDDHEYTFDEDYPEKKPYTTSPYTTPTPPITHPAKPSNPRKFSDFLNTILGFKFDDALQAYGITETILLKDKDITDTEYLKYIQTVCRIENALRELNETYNYEVIKCINEDRRIKYINSDKLNIIDKQLIGSKKSRISRVIPVEYILDYINNHYECGKLKCYNKSEEYTREDFTSLSLNTTRFYYLLQKAEEAQKKFETGKTRPSRPNSPQNFANDADKKRLDIANLQQKLGDLQDLITCLSNIVERTLEKHDILDRCESPYLLSYLKSRSENVRLSALVKKIVTDADKLEQKIKTDELRKNPAFAHFEVFISRVVQTNIINFLTGFRKYLRRKYLENNLDTYKQHFTTLKIELPELAAFEGSSKFKTGTQPFSHYQSAVSGNCGNSGNSGNSGNCGKSTKGGTSGTNTGTNTGISGTKRGSPNSLLSLQGNPKRITTEQNFYQPSPAASQPTSSQPSPAASQPTSSASFSNSSDSEQQQSSIEPHFTNDEKWHTYMFFHELFLTFDPNDYDDSLEDWFYDTEVDFWKEPQVLKEEEMEAVLERTQKDMQSDINELNKWWKEYNGEITQTPKTPEILTDIKNTLQTKIERVKSLEKSLEAQFSGDLGKASGKEGTGDFVPKVPKVPGGSFFSDSNAQGSRSGGRQKAIAKKTLQHIADLYKPKRQVYHRIVVHSPKTKELFTLRNIKKLTSKLKM